jgi:hypothetical protein
VNPLDVFMAAAAEVEQEGVAPTHFIMSRREFFRGHRTRKSMNRWFTGAWGKQRANV